MTGQKVMCDCEKDIGNIVFQQEMIEIINKFLTVYFTDLNLVMVYVVWISSWNGHFSFLY